LLIALHDAEQEHIKRKTFPNYALMKISAHHKARGDTAVWWNPLDNDNYDAIYSSKVFDFTPENPYLPEWAIRGGTGYGSMAELPPKVDATFPDYSIYPACDYAIGYVTRGCPNSCPWCVVPEKEGDIKPYRRWRELVRPDSNKLVLMDNNILSCEYGINELQSMINSGYAVDLNQGLDARLVDKRIAGIIGRLKWIKYIRFSCDTLPQIEAIHRAAALLAEYNIKPYRLFVYVLVTKDIGDAARRVEGLRELNGISLYAQAERNTAKGIIPNGAQLEFAQRYVYGRTYRKETWAEYCHKRNFDFMGG